MPNQLRSRLTQSGLQEAPPTPRGAGAGRSRILIAVAVVAALLALAWFEGGEEPLRPIAQDVALPVAGPEAGQ